MTPVTMIALALVQLATKILEMRLEHYKVRPELAEEDADNALLLMQWGEKLLRAAERLFGEIEKEPPAES